VIAPEAFIVEAIARFVDVEERLPSPDPPARFDGEFVISEYADNLFAYRYLT
jgi:hypothetical protein